MYLLFGHGVDTVCQFVQWAGYCRCVYWLFSEHVHFYSDLLQSPHLLFGQGVDTVGVSVYTVGWLLCICCMFSVWTQWTWPFLQWSSYLLSSCLLFGQDVDSFSVPVYGVVLFWPKTESKTLRKIMGETTSSLQVESRRCDLCGNVPVVSSVFQHCFILNCVILPCCCADCGCTCILQ